MKCSMNEYKIKKHQYYTMKEIVLPQSRMNVKSEEVEFLQFLNSPTVIGLKESVIKNGKLYMILEYAPFGTLKTQIAQKRKEQGSFTTKEILDWMTELFLGLYVIHKRGFMHRDIKSENLFIGEDNLLKIGDFGLARPGLNSRTVCGTVLYMAPEIQNNEGYTNLVDIWSAGIVLYELVMLRKPFEGINVDAVKAKIMGGRYDVFPPNVVPKLKRLLSLTLNRASQRATAEQILSLSFIRKRLKHLFTTKIKNDNLLQELSKIKPLPASQLFPFEGPQEKKLYIKDLKSAVLLQLEIPHTSYSEKFYSMNEVQAIDERYLEIYCGYNKELLDLINHLKNQNLLVLLNPKSKY